MRLTNKVAIVTGSGRGIGRAIALALASEGAKVVVNFVNDEPSASKTVADIVAMGSEAVALKADVSLEEEVKGFVEEAINQFGHLDILVNNAGVVTDTKFLEQSVSQWQKVLGVNLIGTYLCSKYASEHMTENGVIINIASNDGVSTFVPTSLDYDSSKAGVVALTKCLARGFAPRIRVNSISPGWVNTDMNKDLPADYVREEKEKIWQKRFAEPDEIARVALFLASDDSSYMTGSNVIIDGGYGI